ncbi:unnamed protein product, partial [Bubo scandiacus]
DVYKSTWKDVGYHLHISSVRCVSSKDVPSSPLLSSVLQAGERQHAHWLLLTLCLT